jgi:hypothetical protein
MNINATSEELQKTDFTRFIREELDTFLSLLDLRYNTEGQLSVQNSELARIVSLLGYDYFYRLYSSQMDPFIDYYFEKIRLLLLKTTHENIIDLAGAFFLGNEASGTRLRTAYDIETLISRASAEYPVIRELKKIFPADGLIPDQGKIILVYLTDCFHDLAGKPVFNELKIRILLSITDNTAILYRKVKQESDLERFRMSEENGLLPLSNVSPLSKGSFKRFLSGISTGTGQVFRNIILLEKAPLILGILFLAIGYSLSYVFSEYKDRPILEYTSNLRQISRDSLYRSRYSQAIPVYWNLSKKTLDTTVGNNVIDKILKHCKIPDNTKTFYVHTLHFKNISHNQTVQHLAIRFLLNSKNKAILYGEATCAGNMITKISEEKGGPISYSISDMVICPNNRVDVSILSNHNGYIPLIFDGVNNIALMRHSFMTVMISNWLTAISIFLATLFLATLLYFIGYTKLKKNEK